MTATAIDTGPGALMDRCTASSWEDTAARPYGPGGRGRCVKAPHHVPSWHQDEHGIVFILDQNSVARMVTA